MKISIGMSLDGCIDLLERMETQVAEAREQLELRAGEDIDGAIEIELEGKVDESDGEPVRIVFSNEGMEHEQFADQILVELSD